MSTVKAKNHQIGADGTASNNFTIYQPSTPDGTSRWAVGVSGATTADVITVNSSGNVGIGTTSPTQKLMVNGNILVADSFQMISSGTGGTASAPTYTWGGQAAKTGMYLPADNTIAWSTVATERMRIDSSGTLLVGKTVTDNATQGLALYPDGQMRMTTNGTASTTIIGFFRNSSSTLVGQISTTSTATAYTTSSDYRLKENIAPMTDALDKVLQLKPVTYKWKVDGSDGQGFIAHELQAVVPDAVSGEKDAVETYTDEEGNEQTRIKPQGIDTSFLIATLTAAIQELTKRVQELEAKVN